MIRVLLLSIGVVLGAGCASGLKSIERDAWVLVTSDDGKGQELILQDSYDGEVVSGRERKVKLTPDERAPVLHEAARQLTAVPGEILRFRVNEGSDVELLSDGAVAEVYWTVSRKVDGWSGDQAVEGRESDVYVRARKPGKGKLKLIDKTWGTHEFELTVKPSPKN